MPSFELQGHRGARGLRPENSLPAFELAFDLGVTSVETDVHLTRDGVPVLFHDAALSQRLCRRVPGRKAPNLAAEPAVSSLTLEELRGVRADRNPDPQRFPDQRVAISAHAGLFSTMRGFHLYTPPTLAELFAFVRFYGRVHGYAARKTRAQWPRVQRRLARQVRFDLELKRVPYRPEAIGDDFDGESPGLLEQAVVRVVRAARMVRRTTVRSFDHRCVRAVRRLEPGLTGAILVEGTAPVDPAAVARQADASVYCPDYRFVDADLVRRAHAGGVRVVPWTVNDPADAERLLDWGVDGLTTDFPDRLAEVLRGRGIDFQG
jgi:glycerophosphoryl diester phosphodiesterase